MVATQKQAVGSEPTIEIRELGGKFYASSPKQGWYVVDLGDERFPASCECADHRFRGRECKHLARVRALLEARQHSCPCCGQPVPETPATDLPWDAATEAKFVARRAALFGEAK